MANKFNIGDRVILTEGYDHAQKDLTGVVVEVKDHSCGIDFKKVYDWAYNLNGNLKKQTGYYVLNDYLKKIETKEIKDILEFAPGMKLTKYVKNIIKREKNINRKKWLEVFDRCILPKDVKDLIEESIIIMLRAEMFEKWGINAHFEKGLTNSILIYGEPGTGKTMVSESIAAVLNKNLLKLDTGALQSNIPGQMERNIKENFENAAIEDAVILLDECDSLLYNRDAVGAIMSSEINALLTEIERFNGVVILTTNRLYTLDPGLQRHIIAKIELPRPSVKARQQIWRGLIPKKYPLHEDVNLKNLSKYDLTGGDIKNAIVLAARRAIAKNENQVKMAYFEYAINNILTNKQKFNGETQTQKEQYENIEAAQ